MANLGMIGGGIGTNEILSSKNIVCECGSKFFTEKYALKKISTLYTGTGKDEIVPIPVWVCDKCGKIAEGVVAKDVIDKILGEENKLNV